MERPAHRHFRRIFVDALFVLRRSIRALSERSGGLTDVVTHELRRLEHNALRRVADLGIQPAHDASQRNRSLSIADAEIVLIHLIVLLVERHDMLARVRAADNNLISAKEILVEGMHRLPHFQKDIVRDVHDIGYGVHPAQRQPAAHPGRGRADLHIVNVVRYISRTQIRCLDRDLETVLLHFCLMIVDVRLFQRLVQNRRDLTGDPEDTLAVRAVCGDRDVEDPVVQTKDRLHVRARLCIVRQNQQPVVARAREEVFPDAKLGPGAEHSV